MIKENLILIIVTSKPNFYPIKYFRALVVKGKALYLQGNFEGAMVLYHRALHIGFASNIEEVRVRQIINRATETVNNSLGTKQAETVFLLMPKMLKR